jgi:hypothetical protein
MLAGYLTEFFRTSLCSAPNNHAHPTAIGRLDNAVAGIYE